ncbi:class I SAM-dependent methyltransferase [Saccharibacillus sp. CPCC 101409]|uniref:class I SAM-dependent methyltransferase n=1 Tax=Saccharibacillus sp. CPCC 101409 TaxID=3058041 RepID=UPI002671120D|nr:class I SAM-dependent methyltransferase [Saccharibacillus sp. CPCC 101409]MDO3408472.1 class I SAM-dependent methyltransferase [Saccharibacillus sp. CPCC 101409]
MSGALEAIRDYKAEERAADGSEAVKKAALPEWLRILDSAEEYVVNYERIGSLGELKRSNPVLGYVERSLEILEGLKLSFWMRELLETVLVWSETAKGGTRLERLGWQRRGINVFVHNEGSADLYLEYAQNPGGDRERERLTALLIRTHGLLGQYLRGEVPFAANLPLRDSVEEGLLTGTELARLLTALNRCVIGAVSESLWASVERELEADVLHISLGSEPEDTGLEGRLRRLRGDAIERGENFEEELEAVSDAIRMDTGTGLPEALAPLDRKTLWYVEAALGEFSLEEFIKMTLLALRGAENGPDARHISFERLMHALYYDYKGVKKINLYKKRIVEKYLRELGWTAILRGDRHTDSPHLHHRIVREKDNADTCFFGFVFSPAAEKLIEFCVEAEKSPLYERAVLMLMDLFGLRRDAYDRFHNEDEYLETMNSSADDKKILLQFISGSRVLDIGPGGGVLLDLIESELPDKEAIGVDISENVIEALNRRKRLEGRGWRVLKGDALNLSETIPPGSIDTVVFSSILHELYSYIPFNGGKFNPGTVRAALQSAFDLVPAGGRILIRDGIMTEPAEQTRRLIFRDEEAVSKLERYAADFEGRKIAFERLGPSEVRMPVNDAMEFLYTYTWGEEAYVHEVQEQFGYFTPSEYEACINELFGERAKIVFSRYFLQEGYTLALRDKVRVTDEAGEDLPLPDSTCIIAIEKTQD